MYERFTDRSRRVMQLANEEAQRFQHEYVGTEHILLALVAEGSGVAANVLQQFDIDLATLRREVERLIQHGQATAKQGKLPQTSRAKKAIELAMEEARNFNHKYVGTEHLLLGLLRETEGVAGQILLNLRMRIEEVRAEILNLLGHGDSSRSEIRLAPREKRVRKIFDRHRREPQSLAPPTTGPLPSAATLIAVDVGNSRMKLGRFEQAGEAPTGSFPEPAATEGFAIENASGWFDVQRLDAWCDEHAGKESAWLVASVHRGAADRLTAAVGSWAKRFEVQTAVRWLTYRDVPLPIEVDEPPRVGIDRLLAALAADRLRDPRRAAVVVDLGSAITVDLVTANGAFAGGAILPGIAMSARALAEQTDALPHVAMDRLERPPTVPGRSTTAAIEAGLHWGALGAIRELIARTSAGLAEPPDVFLTGGASAQIAELLNVGRQVRHVPHLVLSGIALVAATRL
jgi:pantothenate kinase type III